MPTGWRPKDVALNYPIISIKEPHHQNKYETISSFPFIIWSFIQLNISVLLMFHFFTVIHLHSSLWNYNYGALILFHIFSFTSALDRKKYSIITEFVKMIAIFGLLYKQKFLWFGLDVKYGYLLLAYGFISLSLTSYFHKNIKTKFTYQV